MKKSVGIYFSKALQFSSSCFSPRFISPNQKWLLDVHCDSALSRHNRRLGMQPFFPRSSCFFVAVYFFFVSPLGFAALLPLLHIAPCWRWHTLLSSPYNLHQHQEPSACHQIRGENLLNVLWCKCWSRCWSALNDKCWSFIISRSEIINDVANPRKWIRDINFLLR